MLPVVATQVEETTWRRLTAHASHAICLAMSCVLKAVLATMLALALCVSAGAAAVAHVDPVRVDIQGHTFDIMALDAHSGEDGKSEHQNYREYCGISAFHCGASYLSLTSVANPHRLARRHTFLPAEDQLLPGCLHEAQTPPPRS
jgi:hypothetical protein